MISVLIITRERTALLKKCLASLSSWIELHPVEVIVILNGDDPETENYLSQSKMRSLQWHKTKEILHPGAARNFGLNFIKGEWTFLIDDDARVTPGYLEYWIKLAREFPLAQVMGGPDSPPPDSDGVPVAVSIALASPLCSGATYKRHNAVGLNPEQTDETTLTSCNLWIRSHWWHKGMRFPENYLRGEETVLLREIQKRTDELWWFPGLAVWHLRRNNFLSLAKASWGGGYFRARVIKESGGDKWYFLSPLFVILHFSIVAMPPFFIFLVCFWLLIVGSMSIGLSFRMGRLKLFPIVIFLHWWILFNYGCGFFQFLTEWGRNDE
jgi:glycosyltransferase involved in cell wall biosynthesis